MSCLLGIDYGTRKIGVAVGQTTTGTAQGLTLIPALSEQHVFAEIRKLVKEWKADAFVVGLPLNAHNEETETSRKARKFCTSLSKQFDLPVYWANEFLTSQAAQYDLRDTVQRGRKFNRRKQSSRDLLAAELILRSYLESTTTQR